MMLGHRHPDAVHRAYAEDEEELPGVARVPGTDMDMDMDFGMDVDFDMDVDVAQAPDMDLGMAQAPRPEPASASFGPPPTDISRPRRLAAMALLGAVVGVVVVLLAHALSTPGVVGGGVERRTGVLDPGWAQSIALPRPVAGADGMTPGKTVRVGLRVSGIGRRSAPAIRGLSAGRGVSERAMAAVPEAGDGGSVSRVPQVGYVGSVPVAPAVAPAAAESEFGFER